MEEIGIRDLKRQISAVLRRVREEKETITIAYRVGGLAGIHRVYRKDEVKIEATAVIRRGRG
jgi:antitoxin (DNA-binding transcriptional repressor) of toxin-antitoxin stability system